jgi:3-oxoacyl-[acyl-carrier protein] reductase
MKTILLTGAASGIGAAIATNLAADGVRLVMHTGSNQGGLDAVADACRAKGAMVDTVLGNLADDSVPEALVERCQLVGQLQGLVLNAGFPDWRAFESLDAAGLKDSLDVVTSANFLMLNQLAPLLKAADHAKVIGISSFLAHKFKVGTCVVPASAAAKAALEALIKSFAAQYAADGICANVVVPGYIKKNAPNHSPPDEATLARILGRIPSARLGMPEEVAELVTFLLSDKANYITGQLIHIDGGLLLQ